VNLVFSIETERIRCLEHVILKIKYLEYKFKNRKHGNFRKTTY
ncbi:hypothetical protein BN863_3920, partial [Formosa agariphila KMM 3901]